MSSRVAGPAHWTGGEQTAPGAAKPGAGVRGALPGLAVAAVLIAGCAGSTTPSAPDESPRGRLDISYFPDPAVGAPAPNQGPGFVTRIEMRIRDLGGVGIALERVEAGVNVDPASVVVLEAGDIAGQAGSSRVEARGLLVVQVEIAYQGEDGLGDIQVVVSGTDDLGGAIAYDGGLPIRFTGT